VNGLAWVVVAYIGASKTTEIVKAGLGYRQAKRRDEAKARTAEGRGNA
jgi:hypothetical protein